MSRHSQVRPLAAVSLFLALSAFTHQPCLLAEATNQSLARLAIVDVGNLEKVPQPFLDALLIAFRSQPKVDLLERADIKRILAEQSCSLAMSGRIDSQCAIQVGKLCAADAFLMLEASKPTQEGTPVRIRLVDSRYGVKVWDSAILVSAKPDMSRKETESIAKLTAQKLERLRSGLKDFVVVGVTSIRSEELSTRWDWLAESLTTGIEQKLAVVPGILLAERSQTRPLSEERDLVTEVPEALLPAAVLVEGAYRMDREKGADAVVVSLRCLRNGSVIWKTDVHGTSGELGKLCQEAANGIISSLRLNPPSDPMDATAEAEMLAAEAKAYLGRAEPSRALPPAEAALALAPTNGEFQLTLLQAISGILDADSQRASRARFQRTPLDTEELRDRLFRLSVRGLHLAEQRLRDEAKMREKYSRHHIWVTSFLQKLLDWYANEAIVPDVHALMGQEREQFEDIRNGFLRVCSRPDRAPGWTRTSIAHQGFRFHASADEAISACRSLLALSVEAFKAEPASAPPNILDGLVDVYGHPRATAWGREKGAGEKIARFLAETRENPEPLIRIQAEWASARFYAARDMEQTSQADSPKALAHATNYVAIFIRELCPTYPQVQPGPLLRIVNLRLASDPQQERAAKIELFSQLIEFLPKQKTFNYVMNYGAYATAVSYTAGYLEQDGKLKEAQTLMEEAIAKLPPNVQHTEELRAAHRRFLQRHPELVKREPGDDEDRHRAVQILSREADPQLQHVRFRRLVWERDLAAIVYWQLVRGGERYGVLWLDPASLKPLGSTVVSPDLKFPDGKRNFSYETSPFATSIACDGQAIYLGLARDGIIAFPKEGPAVRFQEENGLASQQIRALDVLDGKLYAIVAREATGEDTGIMEVNSKDGQSKLLLSSRTREPKIEVDGRRLRAIASDPVRHALWVLVGIPHSDGIQSFLRLFLYDPQNHTAEPKQVDPSSTWFSSIPDDSYIFSRRCNQQWLVWRMGGLVMDLSSETVTPLWSFSPYQASKVRWVYSFPNGWPELIAPVGEDLICVYQGDLQRFQKGKSGVESITEKCFGLDRVGKMRIVDLMMSKVGLLILAEDSLYMLPGFKDGAEGTNESESGK